MTETTRDDYAAKAAAFDWLMQNCIKTDSGWLELRFETSRPADHANAPRWVAQDIGQMAGVDLPAD